MTKTIWHIIDEETGNKTELTFYHFGKDPKFPSWYMEEGHTYIIEMIWNVSLIITFKTFFRCLTHFYIIK